MSVSPTLVLGPDMTCTAHFETTLPTYRTLTTYYVNRKTNDPTLYNYNARRRIRVTGET